MHTHTTRVNTVWQKPAVIHYNCESTISAISLHWNLNIHEKESAGMTTFWMEWIQDGSRNLQIDRFLIHNQFKRLYCIKNEMKKIRFTPPLVAYKNLQLQECNKLHKQGDKFLLDRCVLVFRRGAAVCVCVCTCTKLHITYSSNIGRLGLLSRYMCRVYIVMTTGSASDSSITRMLILLLPRPTG